MKVVIILTLSVACFAYCNGVPADRHRLVDWSAVRAKIDEIAYNVRLGYFVVISVTKAEYEEIGDRITDKLVIGINEVDAILNVTLAAVDDENLTVSLAEINIHDVKDSVDQALVNLVPEIDLLLPETGNKISGWFNDIQNITDTKAMQLYSLLSR